MGQIEHDTLENLIREKERLDHKLASASDVYAHIETAGWINQRNPKALKLRLDVTSTMDKFTNLDRVGNIKLRLRDRVLPVYRSKIELSQELLEVFQDSIPSEEQQPTNKLGIFTPVESPPPASTTAVPLSYEQPPERPKIPMILKRHPEVYQRVEKILGQIEYNQINKPLDNPQLTKFFPNLRVSVVDNFIEKCIVTPQKGRDHHPVFTAEEIAVMLYVAEHAEEAGGMTPRMVKELKNIVREQVNKRGQSQNNHKNNSGK